jgi:hypothetical protein
MRDADSLLTSLSDEEIRKGISALRALPENPFPPVKLTLITAERLTSPYITKASTDD